MEADESMMTRKYTNKDVSEENKSYPQKLNEAHNVDQMLNESDEAESEEQDNRSISIDPKERSFIQMYAKALSSDGLESEEPDERQMKRKTTKKPSGIKDENGKVESDEHQTRHLMMTVSVAKPRIKAIHI